MSKMDNLRAMREAKYAEAQKRAAAAPARPKAAVAPPAAAKKAAPATEPAATESGRAVRPPQHERSHLHARAGPRGQEPPLLLIPRRRLLRL